MTDRRGAEAPAITDHRAYRIAGSGPVSLACALFLVRKGVPAHAVSLQPAPDGIPAALAARPLAIAHGSRQLLDRLITFPECGTIRRVEVSMPGHAGRTRIAATDLAAPALGYVVRYGTLAAALREAVAAHAWSPQDDDTALTIHAEGDPGPDAQVREFDQCALVGEVSTPQAAPATAGTAFERFTDSGPLALLPLPGTRRMAMVWCDTAERCEARCVADPQALSSELCERFGPALGPLSVEGALSVVPLARRMRARIDAPGEVWIGNAAQALHPVAGQGLNLGLRDAFELAGALAVARRRGTPIGQALDAHRRARSPDRRLTVALTDLMADSFTWPLARPLQSPMLAALDLLPGLRRPLASQLMFGWR
jgi:2-octaprenyl-6-methoxyphenol hydroxylase